MAHGLEGSGCYSNDLLDFAVRYPQTAHRDVSDSVASDVSGFLDIRKQVLAHWLSTQNFPLGLCYCFSPKGSIKAGIMVLRWQSSNLRAIQKHKWCVFHTMCYKLGSWSRFLKKKFNLGHVTRGEKGLSRMLWNKQKIIHHFSALFVKVMVLGFEIFCFSHTFISCVPVFVNNYINVTF